MVESGPARGHTADVETWYQCQTGPLDAAGQMALDEALMEAAPRLARPVVRFYRWTAPAATFGLTQVYAEVSQWTAIRPLVRRPTGGGLVLHQGDWTYSLVFPPNHPWFHLRAQASYQRLHAWLQAAWERLGVGTELSPTAHSDAPGQCFAGAERFDLVRHDRKLAGAAQRRTRQGFLIQGSAQNQPEGVAREAWETAWCAAGEALMGIQWVVYAPDPEVTRRADELRLGKYSQPAHNQRR